MPTVVQVHPGPQFAGVAQLVEHQPSKLRVAGSSLVFRSTFLAQELKNNSSCQCSSGVEHFHGKEGVASSNLAIGSIAATFFAWPSSFIAARTNVI